MPIEDFEVCATRTQVLCVCMCVFPYPLRVNTPSTLIVACLQKIRFMELDGSEDFKIRFMELDGKTIKLHIWNTAGPERFRTISSSFYRGAHGIFVIYDVTDDRSFQNLNSWLRDIDRHAAATTTTVYRLLVGNKSDLTAKRVVSTGQGRDLAESFGRMGFMETSAKTLTNVEKALLVMTNQIIKTAHIETQPTASSGKQNEEGTIHLASPPTKSNDSCTCGG
eukprot:CAMPEP_0116862520 /NCGR_PEP_ID=MMETSP0418-20121206/23680_1 /TAXON_ID=1158023 /ORGANISM="Astrosyne radiata, Strain 13vi08-1A" /LENGTH=222 /DNA_ID=CAMNT_0004497375 /DNA_START=162 /DNA_END=831 /DNA_ORIENTATION=+